MVNTRHQIKIIRTIFIGFAVFSVTGMLSGFNTFAETLMGSVSYQEVKSESSAEFSPELLQHSVPVRVSDESTGKGIEGVQVWMPQSNYQTTSDHEGRVYLPKHLTRGHDTITRFKCEGYAPKSITLKEGQLELLSSHSNQGNFQVNLKKSQSTIILDDRLRHLGDGSFAANSAGTQRFRQQSQGPVFTKKFRLNGDVESEFLTLTIGSVIGLDTQEAQMRGQSRFHKSSSPMLVTLNGYTLGYIGSNGDGHQLRVNARQLNPTGVNTLAIHTGYHRPDGIRVDYDDMELMLLTLDFSG